MKRPADLFVPGPLLLSEQAVHLLRRKGGGALVEYYIGSLPFILGLLYFWSDMSRSPDAGWYCGPAAAGLALLFIWMKLWQVRFCRRLWCALQDTEPEPWTWRRNLTTAARQAALQATGAVVLLLATIIMLPLAWTYAFYQNLSVMDGPETRDLRRLYTEAADQALLWPGQNHVMLTLISVFGLFVCLNIAAGLMVLPYLLKWLLGIETAFTVSGLHAMANTTFLAITGALTYLCVDPIVKAAYTLRCFYGKSRRSGDDLRAGLKPFLRIIFWVLICWSGLTALCRADQTAEPTVPAGPVVIQQTAQAQQLDQAIEQVLTQRRFAWRLPREKKPADAPEQKGWLWDTLRWLGDQIEGAFQAIDRWLEALSEWLRKHLPQGEGMPVHGGNWDRVIRILFYGVGAGLVVLLLLLARNWLRAYRIQRPADPKAAGAVTVDLTNESITADHLPREQWLALASDLLARKEYRQALRAYYLSILAQLGDHGRIVITRYKSNREYLGELKRRTHVEPELFNLFERCVGAFERTWYGMHAVAEDQMDQFVSDQERIASLVQQPISV